MPCPHAELAAGAYVADPATSKLYEVRDVDPRNIHLIDVRSPIEEPAVIGMLTVNAVRDLQLVRRAPCCDDIASIEEWGAAG